MEQIEGKGDREDTPMQDQKSSAIIERYCPIVLLIISSFHILTVASEVIEFSHLFQNPDFSVTAANMTTQAAARRVTRTILGLDVPEGNGVTVKRTIGSREFRNLDPFLMLDEFSSKAPAGFPDHPHRGFETVTYMLSGTSKHEDFKGNKGFLKAGDLQWMTAGRGIVHSELPHGDEPAYGLQLWVNLAKKEKLVEPEYQELEAKKIPQVEKDGVKVKVIAGEALGCKGTVRTRTPAYYLDFTLQKGALLNQPIPKGWTSFVYILSGKLQIGRGEDSVTAEPHNAYVLGDGDYVEAENKEVDPCHFVLISGKPINEPIARGGPFVMTTQEELEQAFNDFRSGTNGFEAAKSWRSGRK